MADAPYESLQEANLRLNRLEVLFATTVQLLASGGRAQPAQDEAYTAYRSAFSERTSLNWDNLTQNVLSIGDSVESIFYKTLREQDRSSVVSQRIARLFDYVHELNLQYSASYTQINNLQSELHEYLVASSTGVDLNALKLHRFLEFSIYLPNDLVDDEYNSQRSAIREAMDGLMASIEFNLSDYFQPEIGSWYQKLIFKSQRLLTYAEVQKLLAKLAYGTDKYTLELQQTVLDEKRAHAISELLKALENQPSAIGRAGSLVVVKYIQPDGNGMTEFVTLTTDELMYIETHQNLMKDPIEFLNTIEKHRCDSKVSQRVEGAMSLSSVTEPRLQRISGLPPRQLEHKQAAKHKRRRPTRTHILDRPDER